MKGNRSRNTRPELKVRSRLHSLGFRYRVDYRVHLCGLTARPDIAFPRRRLAVYIDGCFWHQCPIHGNMPVLNREYWRHKLELTAARDRRHEAALRADGWSVIRAWEHEDPAEVADLIAWALKEWVPDVHPS
jgi:DNA mismatch endonuclease (patch repair protein)